MQEIKKIVILGPESTGKSTLCRQLAVHYNTLWCQEYAREYLAQHGVNYGYGDLLKIAKGQLALEDECVKKLQVTNSKFQIANSKLQKNQIPPTSNIKPLFIDTNMYVMKVWCGFVFGKCHQFILDEIAARKYDLYLLCNTDLPWVKDDLREYPDLKTREQLYDIYKDIMLSQHVPWADVRGDYEERKSIAITAVNGVLHPS